MIAWPADRGNRRWLIFAGVTVWSFMTMACGLAIDLPGAVPGARRRRRRRDGQNPPARCLCWKDYFPPDRLGRAIGPYTAGARAATDSPT